MPDQLLRDEDVLIKTYRYLRIGMVVLVLLLATSVVLEATKTKCLQTSISAYYYTPVQAIFVGGLLAIGVCLIVIKGSTPLEDVCLNLAGMLAPIVALVPTSQDGAAGCTPSSPAVHPRADVVANINNNVSALLLTGFGALLIAFVIGSVANKSVMMAAKRSAERVQAGLWTVLVVLVAATVLFLGWKSFDTRAHSLAALAMFAFLAGASAINWWELRKRNDPSKYRHIYGAIAAAMVAVGILVPLLLGQSSHKLLVLEATEIILFAAFWLNQTAEHWNQAVRPTRL